MVEGDLLTLFYPVFLVLINAGGGGGGGQICPHHDFIHYIYPKSFYVVYIEKIDVGSPLV